MDEEFGASYINIVDDEGNEFELEYLDTIECEGREYAAFLPADMAEDDPDYGIIILRIVEVDGEEQYESVDDEDELQTVYERFMKILFEDEEE